MKLTVITSKPLLGFYHVDKNILTSAIVDGYSFGDRLLEGVIFKATVIDQSTMEITLDDKGDEGYMSDLNAEKMFKYAAGAFLTSGNSSTRKHGVHQGNDKGYDAYPLGNETTPSTIQFRYDIDPHLLKETGYRSFDGEITNYKWEENG